MPTTSLFERRPKRTKTALERSIAKWEANTKAEHPHQFRVSSDDCPLCLEFKSFGLIAPCSYCPVYRKTGANFCRGTPYIKASNARHLWVIGLSEQASKEQINQLRANAQAAAREEVKFLKSLRKQEPTT